MIITRNWRDVHPTIAHKSGLDWRLLSTAAKTNGDIEVEVEPKYQCLKSVNIPEKTVHSILNNGEETVNFLACGGFTADKKRAVTIKLYNV